MPASEPGGPFGSLRAGFARSRFLRYLTVGVVNTGFSYGMYALFLWCGLGYRLASLLALVLGIFWSYATQRVLVFRAAGRSTLLRYGLAWSFLYFLNIGIIGWLQSWSLDAYVAGALAALPVTVMSYFVLKIVVFSHAEPGTAGHPRG